MTKKKTSTRSGKVIFLSPVKDIDFTKVVTGKTVRFSPITEHFENDNKARFTKIIVGLKSDEKVKKSRRCSNG